MRAAARRGSLKISVATHWRNGSSQRKDLAPVGLTVTGILGKLLRQVEQMECQWPSDIGERVSWKARFA